MNWRFGKRFQICPKWKVKLQVQWLRWLFLQSTVFSTWLVKEISAASNIKARSNRQNVQRLLTILNQKFSTLNLNIHYQLGIFCYVGINEFGEEIIEFIEPDIKLDLFYYSCSNKFETSFICKYIGNNFAGTIIFVNGDDCLGYQFKSDH